MNLVTKFDLRDKVKLPQLIHKDLQGTIISIWFDNDGLQYKVRYFWECKPQEVFFFAEELEEAS